ncbi:MAG: protoporphyrinogen oxidase HemJ [Gammaproteobacteria bacterium]|nr:protoporphyrinogen oxidase HemJ [Gammaproteobacteria bacterium]
MLWIKSFHIIFLTTWFAGLFYLPRLFMYHAMSDDSISDERFKIMERKLFAITTIGGVLTVVFGLLLLWGYGWQVFGGSAWLHAKMGLVAILITYHIYCGKLVRDFKLGRNNKGHVFYRWFNEFPVVLLVVIVILVVVKPG